VIRAIRPSWAILFWGIAYTTVFYPFQYQPVELILSKGTAVLILAIFVVFFLIVSLIETRGLEALASRTFSESPGEWVLPQWLRALGAASTVISAGLLLLVCVIVFSSGAATLTGWRNAMESAFPEFGRIFLHLKQIAIPYLVLRSTRLRVMTVLVLFFYVTSSIIYSFTMGERVFFLETALLILVSAMLRGWLRVSLPKLGVAGFCFVAFFMIVENAKRLISTDTQSGNFFENFSLFSSSLIERLLAYYADPAAKMQFVLADGGYFSDFIWFKNSLGVYIGRFGANIDFPVGINVPYWSSGYGGPVLTNPGGFTALLTDFGPLFFVPIVFFLSIFIWAYRHTLVKSPPAAIVYLVCLIAALELPRVAYFYWARFWMPLLLMVISLLLFKLIIPGQPSEKDKCVESQAI
jgi:hypothetical protein